MIKGVFVVLSGTAIGFDLHGKGVPLDAPGDGYHYGPWASLFDRPTQEAIGEPTPQETSIVYGNLATADTWEEYSGPRDPIDP